MSNLNKEQIITKVKEIKENGKKLGIDIKLNENDIYPMKQDAIWYGGQIASFIYKNYKVEISVVGIVDATLYKNDEIIATVKDKNNSGEFFNEMKEFIEDDEKLFQYLGYTDVMGDMHLEYANNNWIEFNIFDLNKKEYLDISLDNVFEENDVLDVFNTLNELINEIDYYVKGEV